MTQRVHIIGAGPAGLTAGLELVNHAVQPIVFEASGQIGGISRTEVYKGYHIDIGGHRFYTKVAAVEALWHDILGDSMQTVPRLSRIYYDGKFYKYPLDLVSTLRQLGIVESARIAWSYLLARLRPSPVEDTFDQWVSNRFGRRLFNIFFKTYTEKVWGIPCSQIQADWAAQRIQNLSLTTAVLNALLPNRAGTVKSLIEEFEYPTHGPGMMWQGFADAVTARGGLIHMNQPVCRLHHQDGQVTHLTTADGAAHPVERVISSMALRALIERLDPAPPDTVLAAARALAYRDFLIVGVIVDRRDLFKDNWLYIHSPDVMVGRIQNFKNWSAAMVPDPDKTCLGMEYFCNEGDAIWAMTDDALIALAAREPERLGLASAALVEDGVVIRQLKAYPVYDAHYRDNVAIIRRYLDGFDNLQTIGRNGLHRYNNQDHSMLTGLFAARNILGEHHDLWDVNTERSYYETFMTDKGQKRAS